MHNHELRVKHAATFRTVFENHTLSEIWASNAHAFDPEVFIDKVLAGNRSESLAATVFYKYGAPGIAVLRALIPRKQQRQYRLHTIDLKVVHQQLDNDTDADNGAAAGADDNNTELDDLFVNPEEEP